MPYLLVVVLMVAALATQASAQSPYAGEESRVVKSMSPVEVEGLLKGQGMGFAKAAELNQYPGPLHVLELARKLHLSEAQVSRANAIFEKMRSRAITLGKQLVGYEKKLDTLFATSKVSTHSLDELLVKIGATRARLRGAHLHAHLEMKEVLSHHQVMMYDRLRGYSNGGGHHHHKKHSH